jgi:RNA polymerase sigma-70 factor, ECF subfamily
MSEHEWLAERFEQHRPRLRAVAYRLLGSLSEADDAVQEAWLRLSRSDADAIDNLEAWLVTVVGRISLNMLRARRTRREQPLENALPDPIVDRPDGVDPEHEALLADTVGLALFVVLEQLTPPERLAFVLHDTFAVPFDEIAVILGRSPDAARQLASRARRRVRGATPGDTDRGAEREVVEAFIAAGRSGDIGALVALLDPDVVLHADQGPGARFELHGAERVARQASMYSQLGLDVTRVLVNGAPGWVATLDGRVFSVGTIAVRDGRIVQMDILADEERLPSIDLSPLTDPR